MPWDEVMHKWKAGTLRSGSDKGPPVKSRSQAVAIMMSEKKKAGEGKKEYMAHDDGGDVKPAGGQARSPDIPKPASPKSDLPKHMMIGPPSSGPKDQNTDPSGQRWLKVKGAPGKADVMAPDYGKEEWQPQGPSYRGSYEEAVRPPAHGGATGSWKRGGKVNKYDEGGTVDGDVKPPTATTTPAPTPAKPTTPRMPKSGGGSKGISVIDVGHSQDATPVVSPMVTAKRGGPINALKKGGEVCASNAKQFKQNLVETAVNQTGKLALAKGGEVAWKKPSWRRW